jgi:hypothetical protein
MVPWYFGLLSSVPWSTVSWFWALLVERIPGHLIFWSSDLLVLGLLVP